jgi:hypothetical protein
MAAVVRWLQGLAQWQIGPLAGDLVLTKRSVMSDSERHGAKAG